MDEGTDPSVRTWHLMRGLEGNVDITSYYLIDSQIVSDTKTTGFWVAATARLQRPVHHCRQRREPCSHVRAQVNAQRPAAALLQHLQIPASLRGLD
jgi:hypothetical protein